MDSANSKQRDTGMPKKPTYLQRLVTLLQEALEALGVQVSESKIEGWSVLIHGCMSSRGRDFHGIQHVFDVSENAGPFVTIAALFHDTVYYQVDGGLLPKQAMILDGVILLEEGEVALTKICADEDPLLASVADIFGFSSGEILSPFGGLNEFLSAVMAVRCLDGVMTREDQVRVAVCIEATIPFRKTDSLGSPREKLFKRLCATNDKYSLGMTQQFCIDAVHDAQDLANRDVANFGTTDRAWFLDNTWKLLPESNIPLRHGALYTVSEYQGALKKMEGFFSFLDPDVIFGSFQEKPDPPSLARMTQRAKRNLEVGRRYIRAKLATMSTLAALALRTGGDAPVAMFMGDLPTENHRTDRLEDFLPLPKAEVELDEEVFELLAEGRKGESNFDLRNAPLSAYLYGILGDAGLDEVLKHTSHPMALDDADTLLARLPERARAEIANGCAQLAVTRAESLRSLAK